MMDETTSHYHLPLPAAGNTLAQDVQRLRAALRIADRVIRETADAIGTAVSPQQLADALAAKADALSVASSLTAITASVAANANTLNERMDGIDLLTGQLEDRLAGAEQSLDAAGPGIGRSSETPVEWNAAGMPTRINFVKDGMPGTDTITYTGSLPTQVVTAWNGATWTETLSWSNSTWTGSTLVKTTTP